MSIRQMSTATLIHNRHLSDFNLLNDLTSLTTLIAKDDTLHCASLRWSSISCKVRPFITSSKSCPYCKYRGDHVMMKFEQQVFLSQSTVMSEFDALAMFHSWAPYFLHS